MGIRIGRVILAVALAVSVVTICPQGRCPLLRKAQGHCCTQGDGLKAPSCCSGAAAGTTSWLLALSGRDASPAPPSLVALAITSFDLGASPSVTLRRAGGDVRGLGPPGPLIDQHTSLLL